MVAPSGQILKCVGLHPKHNMTFNVEKNEFANSKKASVTISEKWFTDAGYPLRNDAGEVFLSKHVVFVSDSTGNNFQYVAAQWYPDETNGLIVIILTMKGINRHYFEPPYFEPQFS